MIKAVDRSLSPSMLQPFYGKSLRALPHIRHGFFTRHGGVSQGIYRALNLGVNKGDDPGRVGQNWDLAASYLGLSSENLVAPWLVHGALCQEVTEPFAMPFQETRPQVDAVITSRPGLGVGVTSADCVPILIASKTSSWVGAIHAGWRGATSGVLESTVTHLVQKGLTPTDLVAVVGPCIHQNSYEVGEDVMRALDRSLGSDKDLFLRYDHLGAQKALFDLPGYVTHLLLQLGIGDLEQVPYDTYTHEDDFFSCRRSAHQGQKHFGVQLSAICLVS